MWFDLLPVLSTDFHGKVVKIYKRLVLDGDQDWESMQAHGGEGLGEKWKEAAPGCWPHIHKRGPRPTMEARMVKKHQGWMNKDSKELPVWLE